MSGRREAGLARYLRPTADQRRLVQAMATGHARARHGAELGARDAAAFGRLARAHLQSASVALAVPDAHGRPRYLLADARTDRVAWITPHREQRSTLFSPRDGAETYVRTQQAIAGPTGWRSVDLAATRAATRGIGSAQRSADRGACARVP